MLSLKPRPFVQSFFDMHAPRQPHAVTQQLSAFFFVFLSFLSLEMSLFPSIFVPLLFSLCMESTSHVFFPPSGWCFFYLVTTGSIFLII